MIRQMKILRTKLPDEMAKRVEGLIEDSRIKLGKFPANGFQVNMIENTLELPRGSLGRHAQLKNITHIRGFRDTFKHVLHDVHAAQVVNAAVDEEIKRATNQVGIGRMEEAILNAMPPDHPLMRSPDFHKVRLLNALASQKPNTLTADELAERFNKLKLVTDLGWQISENILRTKAGGKWLGLIPISFHAKNKGK
ncbi:MAG: hypothetical protein ABH863_02080 [Candidatus Micrarchaeota archaeon]